MDREDSDRTEKYDMVSGLAECGAVGPAGLWMFRQQQ